MSTTDPEAALRDATAAVPGSAGRAGLISTLGDDRPGWAVLAFAVGLTALLQAIPPALASTNPIYAALFLNGMFQWSFSIPIMTYLACKGRLGWLAALYGVVAIGAAHYAAFALGVRFHSGPFYRPDLMSSINGYAAGFTGAALSFLAFQAYGAALRTRRALVLMAGGMGVLTALGGLLKFAPIQILYVPWQLAFGTLILMLTRSRRATRLW